MHTIMIVDDSPSQRAVIESHLESLQCQIEVCNSGEDALLKISERIPDVIILDVEMKGLDGFDTCKAMRGFLQEFWVPIIYLTSHTTEDYMIKGLNAGGDSYVHKPVNQAVLIAIVRAMLRIADVQEELIEANKKLNEIAYFDVLTQIMNRRGFDDMYHRLWDSHKRRRHCLSMLLMDIDHFKLYNDNYGHIKGDECLRKVAQVIKNALLRPIDIVARYGGEEFVVLLPDTEEQGAMNVAERILEAVKTANLTHEFSKTTNHVSISIGIASSGLISQNQLTPEAMLKSADEGLYLAKESGRNQWAIKSSHAA